MSNNVDQRVVEMKFNNKDFGAGVSQTLSDLDKLKAGLKLEGATAGLSQLNSAAKDVDFNGLGDKAEQAGGRINAAMIFARTAIATLSYQVVRTGEDLIKSLTISPVAAGLESYTEQINATQTILANTQAAGTSLGDVTNVLAELQKYANQTVYSFSDMTKNIGTFTAAGVGLNDSVSSIKGIANLAAMSGATADQASSAMYQLSQAIASGKVHLQDWNSVVNAGIGGKTFQTALENTARAEGTNIDAIIKKQGSFRDSLQKGWLTSKILTDTLKQFTGDLSDAQLKSMGYTTKQIADIQKLGQTALASAVNIRTIPQMMQALKEEVATAYGAVFKTIFGDINQATSLFTGMHNAIENALTGPIYAFNDLLQGWAKLGGRDLLFIGIKNAIQALNDVIGPFKIAFRDIFPPATAEGLLRGTEAFVRFTQALIPSGDTVVNLTRTFRGFFAILDIGKQFLSAAATAIGELIGHITSGGGPGGILKFTANIGDFVVKLDQAIKSGQLFTKFFDVIVKVIEKPIDAIKAIVGALATFIGGIASVQGANTALDKIQSGFGQMADTGHAIADAWARVKIIFDAIGQAMVPVLNGISGAIHGTADDVGKFLKSLSFGDILGAGGVGGIAVIALTLKKLVDTVKNLFKRDSNSGPGLFDKVKESLEQLTKTLQSMQQMLKAATLLEIAAAILVLTIAVSTLSKIDAGGLARAVTAIGVMMTELVSSMKLMDKFLKDSKALKLDELALGLILMATAVDILASAASKLAALDWNGLAKGLTGVVVLLGAMAGAMRLMPEQSKMISSGAGLILLAEAIKVLVDSVKSLAGMSWADMAKGLTGVAALLLALDLFTKFNNTNNGGIKNGVGIVLLAAGIKILVSALQDMGRMSWEEIAKGLSTTAGGLLAISTALRIMPDSTVLKAAAVTIIAAALKILASAMKDMGDLSWEEIAKGMTTIAGSLGLITIALNTMPDSTILKATGLVVVSAALKILASAMADMGGMSWEEIGRSLVVLAGSLLIIVVALNTLDGALSGAAALVVTSFALKTLADVMKSLGGMSWSDIGAALVALGGAMLILVVGLNAMEIALPGALALIVAAGALKILAGVLVQLGGMSWSDIGAAIGSLGLLFAALAVGGLLTPLILPLAAALVVLAAAVALVGGGIALAGLGIKAFADGLTELASINSEGIANLANALDMLIQKIPEFAAAIALGMVTFADTIANGAPAFGDAASAVMDQLAYVVSIKMPELVAAFAQGVVDSLQAIASRTPEFVNAAADIMVNFLNGIANRMGDIAQAGTNVVTSFLNALGSDIPQIVTAGFQMIIAVMNGIADSIRQNMPQVIAAAKNIGSAIIDGITGGITGGQGGLMDKMKSLATGAMDTVKHILGIASPSKVFTQIGKDVVAGFAIGITTDSQKVASAADKMAQDLVAAMQAADQQAQSSADKLTQLTKKRDDDNRSLALAETRLTAAERARKKNAATIQSARDAVIKAKEAVDQDNASIADERDLLAQATDQRNRAAQASDMLTRQFDTELYTLKTLADGYSALGTQVTDAQKALDDMVKSRDSYAQSTSSQYDKLPSIAKDTSLFNYEQQMQSSIRDTQTLADELKQVRDIGLNDTLYKQLVSQGTDAVPFVQQIIDGGKAAVDTLNNMQAQLDTVSQTIGGTAADALYKAGIDSAQGLVDGLKANQEAVHQQMEAIANDMTQRLKDTLGIQSPSTVMAEQGDFAAQGLVVGLNNAQPSVGAAAAVLAGFVISGMSQGLVAGVPTISAAAQGIAEAALTAAKETLGVASPSKEFIKIGQWSSEGMATGLTNYSGKVSDAADHVGNEAINAMRKTISGLGDMIANDIDTTPVITPVLDLSNVKMGAAGIGSLLGPPPISIDGAYASAVNASAGYRQNQAALAGPTGAAATPAAVTFVQNNNSPAALSSATIYRQTKNQLSLAKGALTN